MVQTIQLSLLNRREEERLDCWPASRDPTIMRTSEEYTRLHIEPQGTQRTRKDALIQFLKEKEKKI
jgi:hypothetical protein